MPFVFIFSETVLSDTMSASVVFFLAVSFARFEFGKKKELKKESFINAHSFLSLKSSAK